MSALKDMTNERLVKLNLEGKTRETVIDELADLIKVEEKVSSKSEFVRSGFEREDVMTTCCGSYTYFRHLQEFNCWLLSRVKDNVEAM